jgi:prophage regulatory protein
MVQRILRRPQVERVTGLKRSSIYAQMADGTFPRPIKLGQKSVGWIETEIAEWQKRRIIERDGIECAGSRNQDSKGQSSLRR